MFAEMPTMVAKRPMAIGVRRWLHRAFNEAFGELKGQAPIQMIPIEESGHG